MWEWEAPGAWLLDGEGGEEGGKWGEEEEEV